MPIKKENRAKYPKNWKEIRRIIMGRALNRCECYGECGLHHDRRCCEVHGTEATWARGKIVLTIHHKDCNPENNDPGNLVALCQRCHNRQDQPHRQKSAAQTRRQKKNVIEMFE